MKFQSHQTWKKHCPGEPFEHRFTEEMDKDYESVSSYEIVEAVKRQRSFADKMVCLESD